MEQTAYQQNMADFRREWLVLAGRETPALAGSVSFVSPYPELNEATAALFAQKGAQVSDRAALGIWLDIPAAEIDPAGCAASLAVYTRKLTEEERGCASCVLQTPPLCGAGLGEDCGVNAALLADSGRDAIHVIDLLRLLLRFAAAPCKGVYTAKEGGDGAFVYSPVFSKEEIVHTLRLLAEHPERRYYDDTAYEGRLAQLHKLQMKLLLEIDRVCRENGILYFNAGGSLLGSIRNQGFVPWDDDIDICMDRPNYERLCAVAPTAFGGEYFFQTYETDPYYCSPYGKLRLKGTRFTTPFSSRFEDMHNEIFIDIFVHDSAPRSPLLYKAHIFLTLLARSMVFHKWEGTPMHFYGRFKLLCKVMTRVIRRRSMDQLKHFEHRILTLWNKRDTGFLYDGMGSHLRNGIFPASLLSGAVDMPFEGRMLPVMVGYDAYLRFLYGDYMEWPLPHQRAVHHENVEFSFGPYADQV